MREYLKKVRYKIALKRVAGRLSRRYNEILSDGISLKEDCRRRLFVVPCDPDSVGGSRGDEAMLMASISYIRSMYGPMPVSIVTSSDKGVRYINNLPLDNVEPRLVWTGSDVLGSVFDCAVGDKPAYAVILGADCIDGFYSPVLSLELLYIYALLQSLGVKAVMTGFSFNSNPSQLVVKRLRKSGITYSLRDPISLDRFNRIVGVSGRLTADVAFLLKPRSGYCSILSDKIAAARLKDMTVVGFNFHPMFNLGADEGELTRQINNVSNNLISLLKRKQNLVILLLPHDDRENLTDNRMLGPIYEILLRNGLGDRVIYDAAVPRADELKELAGLTDGIISSRMHLAIAALGQGVPVFTVTYQGKFQGLYRHFNYPEKYMVDPAHFYTSSSVERMIEFVDELPYLKQLACLALPSVIDKAKRNFE